MNLDDYFVVLPTRNGNTYIRLINIDVIVNTRGPDGVLDNCCGIQLKSGKMIFDITMNSDECWTNLNNQYIKAIHIEREQK